MVPVFGLPSDFVYVLVCALCNIPEIALVVVLSSGTEIFVGLCHKAKAVVFRSHQTGHS